MKDRIEQLVHELFALDPSLRAHEAQVRALLTQLLQSRPDVSVDPAFARSLKERLLAVYPHAVMARPASASWSSFFRPVMAYPLAGIAVIVLIAGLMRGDNAASPLLQGGMVTRSLGSEAFGPLILASGQGSGGGAEVTAKSEGLSSSDQAPPAPSSLAPMMGGMGGGSVETRLAPEVLPVPVVYRYVYRGEPVELPDSASVYRRVSGAGPGIGDLLQSLNLGLVDPASFPNSKVQSLNLLNDDYSIFVNLTEGSININETWKGGIPEMRPLTTRDIPPDPELIAIVDAFIRNHGISREGYGEPFVLK